MATFAVNGLNKYTARLRSESKRINAEGEKAALDAAEYGANLMREYILTRGTGWVGYGPRADPAGRIDYGVMYDAVEVGHLRRLKSGVAVTYGWGANGAKVEKYFAYQEEGFGKVPPMHALLDSLVRSRAYFYQRLKEII